MKQAQDFGHIRALDGIRGFALIFVFVYHALLYEIVPASNISRFVRNFVMMGWSGVDLFFVLSGFLITTILLDARAADNYFKVFYIRRALRILPLYYLVLIASLVFMPGHYGFKAQFFYWLNLSNLPTAFRPFIIPYLAHYWSLAIEEQFYFVWPSVVRWLRVRMLAYVCLGVIGGVFVLRNFRFVLNLNDHWPELVYRLTVFRVDTLCAGALLAIVVQQWPHLVERRNYIRIICIASACVFLYAAFGRLYMAPSSPWCKC